MQVINFIDQVIANVSSSGVFVLDRKTAKIITCNNVFAQIHGYTSIKDLHEQVYWNLLLPMDIQSPLMTFEQTGYFQGEVRAFTQGRDIILLDFTILDINHFDIILGLVRDITEQRKAMKRLTESESKYRTFVENIREGFMILDKQENIAFVNPVLCSTLGYTKTELIRRNFSEIIYPEDFKLIKTQIKDGDKEPLRHLEMKMREKSGQDKTFFVSTVPLYDSQSSYTGAIIVCFDVTDLDSNRLADTRGFLLRMIMSETSEQLLLSQGWLDIIKTSLPEQHERIEKVIGIIGKAIQLNRQVYELEGLKPILEFPLLLVSVPKFLGDLNALLKPLVSSKGCLIKFNLQLEQPNLYKCPRILMIAIEQIVRNSLVRSSKNITMDIRLTSNNQMQLKITDDGKTFFEIPESPEKSQFLMDIYLADVLLREIDGKVTINNILPKEGLQFSLIFPLNSINI